jgi:hypothetical protein
MLFDPAGGGGASAAPEQWPTGVRLNRRIPLVGRRVCTSNVLVIERERFTTASAMTGNAQCVQKLWTESLG